MKFETPLVAGTLVRRYLRFLADVLLDDGRAVTAHTPNTGSMLGCAVPGSRVWLSACDRPGRKLPYTWELASDGPTLVGVHTGRSNRLAEEAIVAGEVPVLTGFSRVRREVPYGEGSRVDLLLERDEGHPRRCFVEVKNVTLVDGGVALFPDAVTARGTKHLAELERVVADGDGAAMVYVVQRDDAAAVRPADHIDPTYGAALRHALEHGVQAVGLGFRVTPEGVELARTLPVELPVALPRAPTRTRGGTRGGARQGR